MNNKQVQTLHFITLAMKDSSSLDEIIQTAIDFGVHYGITKEDIEEALNLTPMDIINSDNDLELSS